VTVPINPDRRKLLNILDCADPGFSLSVLKTQRLPMLDLNVHGDETGKRKFGARLEELKVLGLQLEELPGPIQKNRLPALAISTGLRRLGEVLVGKSGEGGQGAWVFMTREEVQEGGARGVALAAIESGADHGSRMATRIWARGAGSALGRRKLGRRGVHFGLTRLRGARSSLLHK
jgi:hypothetical protein